jgi:hypothetical protein
MLLLCLLPPGLVGPAARATHPRRVVAHMNIFGDIFDDGLLKAQTPYERPLLPKLVKERVSSVASQPTRPRPLQLELRMRLQIMLSADVGLCHTGDRQHRTCCRRSC